LEESIERQLSSIEDGITKLIKSQIVTFKIIATNQMLFYTTWASSEPLASLRARTNLSYTLTFGLIAVLSVAIAIAAFGYAANRPWSIVAGGVITVGCIAFGIYLLRRTYGLQRYTQEVADVPEKYKNMSEEYEQELKELSKYVDALEEEFEKPFSSSKDDIF